MAASIGTVRPWRSGGAAHATPRPPWTRRGAAVLSMARENAREAPMLCAKRRTLLVAMAAAVAVLATPAAAQQAITLHGAVQFNDDHAFNKALLKFEERVK